MLRSVSARYRSRLKRRRRECCGHRHSPPAWRSGFKYTIPMSALPKLAEMNKTLQPRGRFDAVMATEGYLRLSLFPRASLCTNVSSMGQPELRAGVLTKSSGGMRGIFRKSVKSKRFGGRCSPLPSPMPSQRKACSSRSADSRWLHLAILARRPLNFVSTTAKPRPDHRTACRASSRLYALHLLFCRVASRRGRGAACVISSRECRDCRHPVGSDQHALPRFSDSFDSKSPRPSASRVTARGALCAPLLCRAFGQGHLAFL